MFPAIAGKWTEKIVVEQFEKSKQNVLLKIKNKKLRKLIDETAN